MTKILCPILDNGSVPTVLTHTVAGETLDQPAVDLVMGHTPNANDMAARYRQRIGDERLEAVAEHVRKWLFPKDIKAAMKKVPVKKDKRAKMA